MTRIDAQRERGAALLAMLAVIMLGVSWFMVSRLNTDSGGFAATKRARNAEVLNRAKLSLIGYVAMQAAEAGEKNPGRLPCPEAVNSIGTSDEGIAAPRIGPPTTTLCSSIGRFPWRTLGLDKLVDSAGEPLWYVVGPSWRLTSSASTLLINSDTPAGDITVDGQQMVALIIAPGAAMEVQASAGCTPRNQTRSAPSPTMDARDYIECFNSTTLQFVTAASSTSSNDQVLRIAGADIMPAIEAAIASRTEREIVPQLKNVYGSGIWGLSSTNPLFPYPAPFSSPNPGTSAFQGSGTISAGLLPVTSASCTGDPRCSTTFVAWNQAIAPTIAQTGGPGTLAAGSTCNFLSATRARCTGSYIASGATELTMTARASNVAMAIRQLDPTQATAQYQDAGWITVASSASGSFFNDGSANIRVAATFPSDSSLSHNFRITMDIDMLADHPLIKSTDAKYGWFVRNEWHRLLYYAVARGHTAEKLPPVCPTTVPFSSSCLSVANVTPADSQRAILILAGRSINGSARPSAALGDYLEFGNASAVYERQPVSTIFAAALKKPFNDRIIVIDAN